MKLAATTAENRLWRAVLEQAYEDAEQPQMADGVDPEVSVRAQRYLRADPGTETEHLKLVCDFAEVPYDRVVSFARKRYSFVPPAWDGAFSAASQGTAVSGGLAPPKNRAPR
jgi:hypothetical protein